MRILGFIVTVITGAFLIYGTLDMPNWGDPNSPASRHVSPRYIMETEEETATPNMVTSVLADYRGYDTLGETTVIFTAGISCILLLRRRKNKGKRIKV
ncbi:MAG TPA: hydrogen gas-evolving membrane-bound hydrogenase subunit E [Desulfatiglandales bacterium]|nr:hydrogen gas-evolving membrane-bound hydrogenase subunit E [Desulfatiglandales bacterium]